MAIGTADAFEGDGNGREYHEQMMDRVRISVAQERHSESALTSRRVGGLAVGREMAAAEWSQAASILGYDALHRLLPQFNTGLPGYPPSFPHN